MKKLNIRDLELKGKKVLVRVDFNVPQDKKTLAIKDDSRIVGALPTINYLMEHGAKVILMSHLGRPEGQVNMQFSLKPVADKLAELLKKPVKFTADCIGPETLKLSRELKEGEV
ncbi:MAG: phosphoglycerate kinase, partial [Deltaproteobacteria bacterium]|nr:phosphoglycerate kinase [Deltaproteobacteria bacterium]